jgi:predicted O-methyltransferase YrrM
MSQESTSAAEAAIGEKRGGLAGWCNRLAHAALPSDYELLDAAGLASGHPWAFLAEIALHAPGSVAYYRYLYGLAQALNPSRILEVGTAFGMSGAAFIQAAPGLRTFISLDLGVFSAEYDIVEQAGGAGWAVMKRYQTEELKADGRNIAFARDVLARLAARLGRQTELALFQVNTQPHGSDNFDAIVRVPHWRAVSELVRELERAPVDLLFIDGKHTGDGLYQDFKSFFPYVRPGGLVICDDLHDSTYAYEWAGDTVESFRRIHAEFGAQIEDSYVWPFPQLPDWHDQESVVRPFGLIRKRGVAELPAPAPDEKRLVAGELARLADGETLDRLRFLNKHKELLGEVESLGLGDEAARRLAWVKDHPDVFAFVARHEPLLVGHPALFQYLADRPQLAADIERVRSRPSTSAPNVELLVQLMRGWAFGRYRSR